MRAARIQQSWTCSIHRNAIHTKPPYRRPAPGRHLLLFLALSNPFIGRDSSPQKGALVSDICPRSICCAQGNMGWQKMLFPGMSFPSKGSLLPGRQQLFPLRSCVLPCQAVLQPVIKQLQKSSFELYYKAGMREAHFLEANSAEKHFCQTGSATLRKPFLLLHLPHEEPTTRDNHNFQCAVDAIRQYIPYSPYLPVHRSNSAP